MVYDLIDKSSKDYYIKAHKCGFIVMLVLSIALSKEFYNDIVNIEMKRYGPNLSSPSGKCFLIVFENGEYDIISQKESKHFKYNGEEILAYNSWLYCNENEFNELINKYLNN